MLGLRPALYRYTTKLFNTYGCIGFFVYKLHLMEFTTAYNFYWNPSFIVCQGANAAFKFGEHVLIPDIAVFLGDLI
jgi:hypothetical protein